MEEQRHRHDGSERQHCQRQCYLHGHLRGERLRKPARHGDGDLRGCSDPQRHGQRPLRRGRGDAECHFRRNHLLVRDPECGQRLHGHGQHLRGHGPELHPEHQQYDDLLPPRHERRRLSLRRDHGSGHGERPAERDGHGCSGSSLCGH